MAVHSNLESSLQKIWLNEKYYDMKFKVRCGKDTTTFYAHKLVLSIWSPVLADILIYENNIEIDNVNPEVIDAILKYLYGSVPKIKDNENDIKFITDVYKITEKYQINALQRYCVNIVSSSRISKINVFELLETSVLLKLENLQSNCRIFIQENTSLILTSYDIENVTAYMINTVLQLPICSLSSELELLVWFFKWLEKEYEKIPSVFDEANTKLQMIESFLPYLNFLALDFNDFSNLVDKYKKFFNEKDCFSIFMNILNPGSVEMPNWYNRGMVTKTFSGIRDQSKEENDSLESFSTTSNCDTLSNMHQVMTNPDTMSNKQVMMEIAVEVLTVIYNIFKITMKLLHAINASKHKNTILSGIALLLIILIFYKIVHWNVASAENDEKIPIQVTPKELEDQLAKALSVQVSLKESIDKHLLDKSVLEDKLKSLEEEKDIVTDKLTMEVSEKNQLMSEAMTLKENISKLKDEMASKVKEFEELLKVTTKEFEDQLAKEISVQSSLKESIDKHLLDKSVLKDKLKSLKEEKDIVTDKLTMEVSEQNQLMSEAMTLKENISKLKYEMASKVKEFKELLKYKNSENPEKKYFSIEDIIITVLILYMLFALLTLILK